MKKKKYLVASVILFVVSIAALFNSLQGIGFFSKNKILVRSLSCSECAPYEVVMGDSKITSQLQGPSDSVNIYQVYITGEPNPSIADYTKTYDYYVVTGKLTALQKAKNSGMIFPVITAYEWKHVILGYEWLFISLAVLFLIVSIHYFIKFRIANRPDVTAAALKTHGGVSAKKV